MNNRIKVGMDISQLAHKGGVVTYTKNLTNKLAEISSLDMIYFYSSLRKQYKGDLRNVKKYRLPPTIFEMLFNRWRNVSIEKFLGPLDIFHSSDWTQPPTKAKKVTTYHDVVAIKYPQWSNPKIVVVNKRRLALVEKEIDCVIAVSESTKKDLMEVSRIPEEKITVIYEGPTGDFRSQPKEKIEQFKKKYKLPDKFVLGIGGVGERRNLARIKEAAKNYHLVIAGESLPWLSMAELELLYNSAQVLVYCSLYEGFGIPILDAFLCGLPIVTSNVSSMPEVGGDAALYADPLKVEDMREKLDLLTWDLGLRQNLIKKGFEQVKKFSWEKCAKETVEVYRRIMK